MIHIEENIQYVKKQIKLSSCLKCNNDDLKVEHYEDTYGDITTVSCKKCKNSTNKGFKVWNEENDIDLLLKKENEQIEKSKNRITELSKLKSERELLA
jgi:hypothetical protein